MNSCILLVIVFKVNNVDYFRHAQANLKRREAYAANQSTLIEIWFRLCTVYKGIFNRKLHQLTRLPLIAVGEQGKCLLSIYLLMKLGDNKTVLTCALGLATFAVFLTNFYCIYLTSDNNNNNNNNNNNKHKRSKL